MPRLRATLDDPVLRYLAAALAWGVGIFGLLRLTWVERHLLLPFTGLQERVACALLGDPAAPISVGLSCSAADVMALCAGSILAFPVPWRRRLTGAGGGLATIVVLNTVRIGTLGRVAADRSLFQLFHIYLWPAALILAVVTYVFLWMRRAGSDAGVRRRRPAGAPPLIRVVSLTIALVILYLAIAPWLMRTPLLEKTAAQVAAVAVAIARFLGVAAESSGGLLRTPHGSFLVTPECVTTPLIPVYLAVALALPGSTRRRLALLAAAPPLFLLLATARLLVLALPKALVGSHLFAIHGFHQLLLAALLVTVAARARSRGAEWRRRTALAVAVGAAAAALAGPTWTRLLFTAAEWIGGTPPPDPQGALLLLPAYQVGLFAALWVAAGARGGGPPAALGAILASQLVAVPLVFSLWQRSGLLVEALLLRFWAVAVPVAAAWLLLRHDSARDGAGDGGARYRRFWTGVGNEFPDLWGARSTLHYRRDEEWLLTRMLPGLDRSRLLKTDLWDEAKNTRILEWAAGLGAICHGVDISVPIVALARRSVSERRPRAVVADVRELPYPDGSFDAVYSMGTVEHFDDSERAIGEIYRVLRPGGRAVVGVPNRHDPFLRPLLVWLLERLGLYGYGFEKSYSRRDLRRMLEGAGFRVEMEEGILFLPGWLRMADLACWTAVRPLAWLTAAAVAPFDRLSRRFPRLRRHGYLLASLAIRPRRGPAGVVSATGGDQTRIVSRSDR